MTLYRYESDHHMLVNLESDTEILMQRQRELQRKAAQVALDLTIITNTIVARRIDEQSNASTN